MGNEGISGSWAGLHRLRASFDKPRTRAEERVLVDDARVLGATAVPLCARELASTTCADHRAWAVTLLRALAETSGDRVRAALREVAAGTAADDAKLAALGLLAELGDETATSVNSMTADMVAVRTRVGSVSRWGPVSTRTGSRPLDGGCPKTR